MRVLVADDDSTTRRMLEAMLRRWNYDVVLAQDGKSAWDLLQEKDSPQLAILDWIMPGMDGVEICRRVREHISGEERYIYIILLTAKTSRKEIVAGLEAGADDYMVKPFDPNELQVRVGIGKRIIELQDELLNAKEALQVQATHDALTGLLNRGAIIKALHVELSRSERIGRNLGVLMLDIDHFKRVNDDYGHLVGDEVLRQCARLIRGSLREYDGVGRFGGEEFLVILPDADERALAAVAERIRRNVAETEIHRGGFSLRVTISVGGVLASWEHDPDTIIQAADKALYEAKERGRNRVCLAAPLEHRRSTKMSVLSMKTGREMTGG